MTSTKASKMRSAKKATKMSTLESFAEPTSVWKWTTMLASFGWGQFYETISAESY
jgi:hypothetical protein